MAAVKRDDRHQLQPLGGCDHRRVDGSEGKVAIAPDELGDPQPVSGVNPLDEKLTRCERAEEAGLCLCAQACLEQVRNLRDDENRDEEGTMRRLERFHALPMVVVVRVRGGVERPGVDEDRYGPASSLRISSIRSEMSPRPLRPTPAKLSRPFAPR